MSEYKGEMEVKLNVERKRAGETKFSSEIDAILREFSEFGIGPAEAIARQRRVLFALSNESLNMQNQAHITRTDQHQAKQNLAHAEKKAKIELGAWGAKESTMVFAQNPTMQATMNNLEKRYIDKFDLTAQQKEILEFLKDKPIALRSFWRYWNSHHSMSVLITYWWLAATDTNKEICDHSTVADRQGRFVYALEDTLRSGNRDELGKDDGDEWDKAPSCAVGFRNKFCEALFGYHPDDVFVGDIKITMGNLTKKAALAVYCGRRRSDRKELYDALKSQEANAIQLSLIETFLSDVKKQLTLDVIKEFGDHQDLFKSFIEEYTPSAEYAEVPKPDKIFEKEELQFAELYSRYTCPIELTFPEDPVRVSRHPAGGNLVFQLYEKETILSLKNPVCPVSNRSWILAEGPEKHGPLLSAKKEMIYFAVFAYEWLKQTPKELFENLQEEFKKIETLLSDKNHSNLIKSAKEIVETLRMGEKISDQRLNPKEKSYLSLLLTFPKTKPKLENPKNSASERENYKELKELKETKETKETKEDYDRMQSVAGGVANLIIRKRVEEDRMGALNKPASEVNAIRDNFGKQQRELIEAQAAEAKRQADEAEAKRQADAREAAAAEVRRQAEIEAARKLAAERAEQARVAQAAQVIVPKRNALRNGRI